jgi:autoinducer 2 (AI-2) kinase
MAQYLMAIDAGTGSVRAVVFDLDGRQVSVEQREWTHLEDPRFPGSMDFDVEHNFRLVVECVSGAIKRANIAGGEIIALSTTSMREGIVLYDREGKEIWACANVDARAGNEVSQLMAISPRIERDIYSVSGQTFALGALPRILWVKNNLPEVYEKTTAVTMLNDWLIYRISGILALEPSNGSTTGMFDLNARTWDPKIANRCGLKDDIYPRVYESATPVGTVSKAFADLTGLSDQCLVVTGGGDAQLGCIGVGAVNPGQACLFGGSFWQLEYNVEKPVTDKDCRVRVNCHAVPGLWQYELIAFFPGLVLRWFRDAFCQAETLLAQQTGLDAYYLLEREARDVPAGSNGMMCTFSDAMNYISWKHAAPGFLNFSLDAGKFNRGVFYHALQENAALVTLAHKQIVESITGHTIDRILFASGASKSPLWCSIVADTLGIPVTVPRVKEATALGTAILAGVGAGVYDNLNETAARLCVHEKTYEPSKENHEIYLELFERWKTVYRNQLALADQGLTNHMWKAPGI